MKKQTKSQENALPKSQELDPNVKRLMNEIELICDGEDVNNIIGALSLILARMVVAMEMHANNVNYIEGFIKHFDLYLSQYACHYKKFHVN